MVFRNKSIGAPILWKIEI